MTGSTGPAGWITGSSEPSQIKPRPVRRAGHPSHPTQGHPVGHFGGLLNERLQRDLKKLGLAVHAVLSDPVSAGNSLQTGKITGKLRKSRQNRAIISKKMSYFHIFMSVFPKSINREILSCIRVCKRSYQRHFPIAHEQNRIFKSQCQRGFCDHKLIVSLAMRSLAFSASIAVGALVFEPIRLGNTLLSQTRSPSMPRTRS